MSVKPPKPYPEFPLSSHNNGQWCKKVNGKIEYFGVWDNPEEALAEFARRFPEPLEQWEAKREAKAAGGKPKKRGKAVRRKSPNGLLWLYRGKWCRKINGSRWQAKSTDPEQAETEFHSHMHFLTHGFVPGDPDDADELHWTIRDVINVRIHQAKEDRRSQKYINDHFASGELILSAPGWHPDRRFVTLTNDDLDQLKKHLHKRGTLGGLATRMKHAKIHLTHGKERTGARLDFRKHFKPPRKTEIEAERRALGKPLRFFYAPEIRLAVANAKPYLRAMLLLGINGGCENAQIADIKLADVFLDDGLLVTVRNKTNQLRKIPLWPETVEAVRAYLDERPRPRPENANYLFITKKGTTYHSKVGEDKKQTHDPIGQQTRRLLRDLGIFQPGVNFGALRHTFRTQAGGETEPIKIIMGHSIDEMSDKYTHREHYPRKELEEITNRVRNWYLTDTVERPVGAVVDAA